MRHILHGHLCGYICDDCPEPLIGSVVRLHPASEDNLVGRVAADPKDTLRIVAADEADSRRATVLAEATVGADGTFHAELPEGYDGGPLDIDLFTAIAPGMKPPSKPRPPVQLHLTTTQPRWQETEGGSAASFEYCVPAKVWCLIRGHLGAWTICGSVTVCDTKQPVAGVVVRAFDTDWIQDDDLGSGVTDAAGHFRIDYTSSAFDRTPFSPVFNIELVPGPDLYFRIEGPGGTPLLVEARAQGRSPGRRNVGPCTCVDLCLTGQVPPGTIPTHPMFTKVGAYWIDMGHANFAADGTTAAGNLAFTGDIPLKGILPDALSPDSIEYRFQVQDLAGGGLNPVDATQMEPTVIGSLQYLAFVSGAWTWTAENFWANNPGATVSIPQDGGLPDRVVSVNTAVKPGGWIEVPRTNSLFPHGDGRFVRDAAEMAILRTTKYTLESFDLTVPAPGLQAGGSVPAASRSAKPIFKIVFEARQVVGAAPVGSDTLPKIAFSNLTDSYVRHPYWANPLSSPTSSTGVSSLGILEMVNNGGCAELGDTMHTLFTAYHPYMGQPEVYFDGNPILPASLFPGIVGDEAASGPGGVTVDITLLAKCAYILWLSVPLRLTSGYGSLGWVVYDHIAFCKK